MFIGDKNINQSTVFKALSLTAILSLIASLIFMLGRNHDFPTSTGSEATTAAQVVTAVDWPDTNLMRPKIRSRMISKTSHPGHRPAPELGETRDIAILFYALSLSLTHTLPSLRANIFDVLDNNNITYHTYVHSYAQKNIRKTITVAEKLSPHFHLRPDEMEKVAPTLKLLQYRTSACAWTEEEGGWDVTDQLILALYSKYKVASKLFDNVKRRKIHSYKYALFMRMDVWVTTPFKPQWLQILDSKRSERWMLTSDVDTGPPARLSDEFGPEYTQVNDKYDLCNLEFCMEIGLSFPLLRDFSLKHVVQSEAFKSWLVTFRFGAQVQQIEWTMLRMRPDGAAMLQECKEWVSPAMVNTIPGCARWNITYGDIVYDKLSDDQKNLIDGFVARLSGGHASLPAPPQKDRDKNFNANINHQAVEKSIRTKRQERRQRLQRARQAAKSHRPQNDAKVQP